MARLFECKRREENQVLNKHINNKGGRVKRLLLIVYIYGSGRVGW